MDPLLARQLLREAPSQLRAFPPFRLVSAFLNLTRSVTYHQTTDHQLLVGLNLLFDHTARKMTFYVFHLGHKEGGEDRDIGFWLQLITFFSQMIDGLTRQFNFKMIFLLLNKQMQGVPWCELSGKRVWLLFLLYHRRGVCAQAEAHRVSKHAFTQYLCICFKIIGF